MNKKNASPNEFEKKSERLDIRVSHQKKQAFTRACEEQSDTPSDAIRRFVSTYIRRANQDNFSANLRFLPWRKSLLTIAVLIGLGMSGLFIVTKFESSKQARIADKAFKIYDINENGLIEVGEISSTDFNLHRVLNIDGKPGISRAEFKTHGLMVWRFVDPDNFEIVKQNDSLRSHSVITRRVHKLTPKERAETRSAGKACFDGDSGTFKEPCFFTPPVFDPYFDTKYVKFDLRDPTKLELTVYEERKRGAYGRSLAPYERSVAWVERRLTPELVMGNGRENAVTTEVAKQQ